MTAHKAGEIYNALLSALQTGLRTKLFAATEDRNRWSVMCESETPEQCPVWPYVSLEWPLRSTPEALQSRRYRTTILFQINAAVKIDPKRNAREAIFELAYHIEDVIADNFCLGGAVAQLIIQEMLMAPDRDAGLARCQFTVRANAHYLYDTPGTA